MLRALGEKEALSLVGPEREVCYHYSPAMCLEY